MRYSFFTVFTLSAAIIAGPAAAAQDRAVRSVDIYVTPLYSAGVTQRERRVSVDRRLNARLRSDDPADIRAVAAEVLADGADVSPLALMVLSARLYDIGDRDEAVFWHYVAKDRFFTLRDVLVGYDRGGMGSDEQELVSAMGAFVQLAGPVINSYAFCDIANQMTQRRRAFDWVAANPYAALMDSRNRAKGSDRTALLAQAIADIRTAMEQEVAYLAEPANVVQLEASRRENGVPEQYCW